jgi:type I restriction-modification system DNA methylase subunit
MMDAVKIVGANGNRRANDFYPTPKECVYALVDYLNIPLQKRIWEPACGDGAIVNALADRGYHNVFGTDIQTGTDFLTEKIEGVDWIITNPPFSLGEKFIRHADEMQVPFAFLLKIQYWNSSKRKTLYDEIRPQAILPLTWRPDFTGQGNSLMDMMWCVWIPWYPKRSTIYQPLEKPKEVT